MHEKKYIENIFSIDVSIGTVNLQKLVSIELIVTWSQFVQVR